MRFRIMSFLINVKSNDACRGLVVGGGVAKRSSEQISRIMVYGGDRPIASLKEHMPRLRIMSRRASNRAS